MTPIVILYMLLAIGISQSQAKVAKSPADDKKSTVVETIILTNGKPTTPSPTNGKLSTSVDTIILTNKPSTTPSPTDGKLSTSVDTIILTKKPTTVLTTATTKPTTVTTTATPQTTKTTTSVPRTTKRRTHKPTTKTPKPNYHDNQDYRNQPQYKDKQVYNTNKNTTYDENMLQDWVNHFLDQIPFTEAKAPKSRYGNGLKGIFKGFGHFISAIFKLIQHLLNRFAKPIMVNMILPFYKTNIAPIITTIGSPLIGEMMRQFTDPGDTTQITSFSSYGK